MQTRSVEQFLSRGLLDVLIRAGLIALLSIACYRVFHPFLDLMLWATILAVTLYPLHEMLTRRLKGSSRLSAILLVLISLAILLVPITMMGNSLAKSTQELSHYLQTTGLHIPLPPESVASWPLVGERVFAIWQQASTDLAGLLGMLAPHLQSVSKVVLAQAAGMGLGVLKFLLAIIIAGILMAYGEGAAKSANTIAIRVAGLDRGVELAQLSTATIRAVAQGVIGIAFIQALLLGLGFIVAGVPGAGILILIVLMLGIVQLPATLVTIPAIIYMFTTDMSSAAAITFAVYTFVAGLADNVLKPLMLGRGVAVPMPVILIGALGGMVTGGIVGLFVGPVTLALGYELFMSWVNEPPTNTQPALALSGDELSEVTSQP